MLAVNLPQRRALAENQPVPRPPSRNWPGKQTTLSLKQGYGFVREHGTIKCWSSGLGNSDFSGFPFVVPREAANQDKMSALISVAG